MFGRRSREIRKRITGSVLCLAMILALFGCAQPPDTSQTQKSIPKSGAAGAKIEEVSPPDTIQQLRVVLDRYQPQVKILGPKPNSTLEDTTVTVQFQVEDFPLFKDPSLGLGPHLHVFMDDRPYQAVYDANQSLTFKDLSPGTHTIRAFASRPWHESVKTPGAFDQLTFHIFAPTQANRPDPAQPLLTYSRPEGVYGAEPILLDYYLTPPVSGKSTGRPGTMVPSSKVKVSLNGSSFTTDEWSPLYLKGFKSGKNWVKLELLDQQDRPISNAYSETLRLVTLNPNGQDTLSKLMRGELTAKESERIVSLEVSQKLAAQESEVPAVPIVIPPPIPTQEPKASQSPIPTISPVPSPSMRSVVPVQPGAVPTPKLEKKQSETPKPSPAPPSGPTTEPSSQVVPSVVKTAPRVSNSPAPTASPVAKPSPETSRAPSAEVKAPEVKAAPMQGAPERQSSPSLLQSAKDRFNVFRDSLKPKEPTSSSSVQPLPTSFATPSLPAAAARSPIATEPVAKAQSTPSVPSPPTTESERKMLSPAVKPSAEPSQDKPGSNWKDFLKLQRDNLDNPPVIKPNNTFTVPSRYLKSENTSAQPTTVPTHDSVPSASPP